MGKIAFTARVYAMGPGGAWSGVDVPAAVSKALGSKGIVRVAGTANGFKFRKSVLPMEGRHYIAFGKDLQAGAKAGPGDTVKFVVELDTKPRIVRAPPELANALATSKAAKAVWDSLPPSHKAEYAGFILEAKRPETRARRIEQAMAFLEKGRRRVK